MTVEMDRYTRRAGWTRSGPALEALTSIARAGADLTITYYAKDAARWIHETQLPMPSARLGTRRANGRLPDIVRLADGNTPRHQNDGTGTQLE